MVYEKNKNIDLNPRTTSIYFVSSAHRRKQKHKSRWTVTVDHEVECFINSQENSWIEDFVGWGLIPNGNSLLVLGQNSQKEELKIAKFVAKNDDRVWHGYPADYCRNIQDRPGMSILSDWRTAGHIEKHHIIKIRQGKECNL